MINIIKINQAFAAQEIPIPEFSTYGLPNPAPNLTNFTIAGLLKGKDDGVDVVNLIFIIIGLVFFANLIMVGWEYMMSSGDPKKVQASNTRLINGLVGLILAFVAFIIVRLITNILGLGTLV